MKKNFIAISMLALFAAPLLANNQSDTLLSQPKPYFGETSATPASAEVLPVDASNVKPAAIKAEAKEVGCPAFDNIYRPELFSDEEPGRVTLPPGKASWGLALGAVAGALLAGLISPAAIVMLGGLAIGALVGLWLAKKL
ncbi:hypothetical protein ACFL6Y_04070 [Elusimicrobiota bacterium]